MENDKKERSRAYPVMSLEEALNRINSISENLGINGQYNRESLAVGMGYSSLNGASARAVAALAHYGFLDREKDQYSLSTLAKKYLLPLNDDDKTLAIREAALTPSLFTEIYNALKGQVIPKQFINRLIQEFNIKQKVATDVGRIFKNTMEFAGILQSNGILNADSIKSSDSITNATSDAVIDKDSKSLSASSPVPSGFLSVILPSGLTISYSQDLASAFAFGIFGEKLKNLDEAVTDYNNSQVKSKVLEERNNE